MLKKGVQEALQETDVPLVPEHERTFAIQQVFSELWAKELQLPEEKRSLWRPLLNAIGLGKLIVGLFLAALSAGGAIGPPLILKAFSEHFSGQNELHEATLWVLVALLLILPSFSSICMVSSDS